MRRLMSEYALVAFVAIVGSVTIGILISFIIGEPSSLIKLIEIWTKNLI